MGIEVDKAKLPIKMYISCFEIFSYFPRGLRDKRYYCLFLE